MQLYPVRPYRSDEFLTRENHLAYRIAQVAVDPVEVTPTVSEMVINRIIDNAAVASASLSRRSVLNARSQAMSHPFTPGSTVFGLHSDECFSPEWAAWANGVAVRELDYHDTFLAADYSHPGDNIPPILAVAQHTQATGAQLLRAIATGYEIQINLVKAISLHKHKIDHVAHLGPSAVAGIGTLLNLDVETIFQAIGHVLHVTTATRQSRKGEISSWKAYAPAFAGKMAVEAIDRAMRGETSPTPIYEGEDGFIAWLLDGPKAHYEVPLPIQGETKLAILESYTKEHSAEYQAQAWIDLARKIHREHPELTRPEQVHSIVLHTSHHTHTVIGSGANDPQKYDPHASRETLDHSIPYIFAVALQDGNWHHVDSYSSERANRPDTVALWKKVSTQEDPEWTERYHSSDPQKKAFGGKVVIKRNDGSTFSEEIAVADAHPLGARPFGRKNYREKFRTLSDGVLESAEIERFLAAAESAASLKAGELNQLTITAKPGFYENLTSAKGLF